MKIGIKYCGGCNPSYNRTEVVKKIINRHLEICFEPVKEGEQYDAVLIVNGCLSACSNHKLLNCNNKIILNSIKDFEKLDDNLFKQNLNKSNND